MGTEESPAPESSRVFGRPSSPRRWPLAAARLAAIGALTLAFVTVLVLLVGEGDGYRVTARFQNASQLVGGEIVDVGGVRAGSVEAIELAENGEALVTLAIEDEFAPLPSGTHATIRSLSLASIAGRRVALALPPASEPGGEIPDGGTLQESETTSEVDLDQLFNTLNPRTVRDFKHVVQGFESALHESGRDAGRGLHYLNPLLSTARRVLAELRTDKEALAGLIVDTSQFSGALAERAPEISALVGNLNTATGAVGRQRAALTAAVSDLPPFLREANTTLVNLRSAVDDLDPLVVALDPVADRLGPFFTELRAAAADAVPTIRDLDAIVRRRGGGNDLVELTRALPPLAEAGAGAGRPDCGADPATDHAAAADDDFTQGALGETTCALRNTLPILAHFRAYTPELVGWFDDFGTSGALDANGGLGRFGVTLNNFTLSPANGLPELLSPVDPAVLFGTEGSGPLLDIDNNKRCPGALERDPGDGSIPFTDGGTLNCDPTQVPTGP